MQKIPMIRLASKDPTDQNTAKGLLASGRPLTIEEVFAIQNAIDIAKKNIELLQERLDVHKSKIDKTAIATIDPVLVFENATKRYTYSLSATTTIKYGVDEEAIKASPTLLSCADSNGYVVQALNTKAMIKDAKNGNLLQVLRQFVSTTTKDSLRVSKKEEDLVQPNANL